MRVCSREESIIPFFPGCFLSVGKRSIEVAGNNNYESVPWDIEGVFFIWDIFSFMSGKEIVWGRFLHRAFGISISTLRILHASLRGKCYEEKKCDVGTMIFF